MKRTFMLSAAAVLAASLVFTSCKPSRVWATKERTERYPETSPPPGPAPRYSASLIISPRPGFIMSRYPDGRYYHRSPGGFLYWKGYDNRFYLDRSYLNRVNYSKWEYNEWKRYSRSANNHNRRY
jgi:hypothetical protein